MLSPHSSEFAAPLENYEIVDCELESPKKAYLLAAFQDEESNEPSSDYRIIGIRLESPERLGIKHVDLGNFLPPSCIGMSFEPSPAAIVMDVQGGAWVSGVGIENRIASRRNGGALAGATTRVKSLGGFAMACTGNRGMLVRRGKSQWECLGPEIPCDIEAKYRGFEDFDGFSENDMYAVGGHGDVWHFDGSQWRQIDFPSNWGPTAVCCAGDGNVYIGVGGGNLYRGKNDSWKWVHEDEMTLPFKDLVWFDNKLWCSSDYGVWTLEGDTFAKADIPPEVQLCAGNLAVRENMLMIAGYGGAALLRDNQWQLLVARSDLK